MKNHSHRIQWIIVSQCAQLELV